jgi:hypothetical protein
MRERSWWGVSLAVSLVLLVLLGWLWHYADIAYQPNPSQLVDDSDVLNYLEALAEDQRQPASEPPVYVPTGVLLQSVQFRSAADVYISGYVWQRYRAGVHDGISRGFILPEAVDSGSGIEPREAYRHTDGDETVIGWYFEATLRQIFDYSKYPLDHKTAWIKIWPADFDRNVILTPDLDAYPSTRPGDAFGIDPDIVLGGWNVHETFFSYKPTSYKTDLGIDTYIGRPGYPELYFNVVIQRKFLDAFIVNLVPLLVCAVLLFAMMLTVTADKERLERSGFDVFGVLGACSALFFVIVLAHIQLRQQLPGAGVVYIEKFYFLMYFVIIAVVADTYLFSKPRPPRFVLLGDNLIPKILFWPVLLGVMVAVTLSSL